MFEAGGGLVVPVGLGRGAALGQVPKMDEDEDEEYGRSYGDKPPDMSQRLRRFGASMSDSRHVSSQLRSGNSWPLAALGLMTSRHLSKASAHDQSMSEQMIR